MIIEPDKPSLNRYYPFLLIISAIKDFIKIGRCQGPYVIYEYEYEDEYEYECS